MKTTRWNTHRTMTKNKHTKLSESAFQKKVLKWLSTIDNCYVVKVVRANRSGVHDIILCYKGRFASIELKKETGKMSALQKIHAHEVRQAGGKFWEVRPSNFELFKVEFMNW